MNKDQKLPTIVNDGFNNGTANDGKIVRGVMLKFSDGKWKDADNNPPPERLIAWAIRQCVQRWKGGLPVETIATHPLPNVNELNAKIPQSEWEQGLSGPRPPYALQHIIHFLDPRDGGEFTFISSTTGAAIAIERLTDKTRNLRMLRGDNCVPVISLDSKLMTTKFGSRLRPEFSVQEWRNLAPQVSVQVSVPAAAIERIGSKVEEPSLSEEMNDEIGF